jgi:hypothetical protein
VADGCEGEGHALACCDWVRPIMPENAAGLPSPASGLDFRARLGGGETTLWRPAHTAILQGRRLEAGGGRLLP